MIAGESIVQEDPIAPVILGITSILAFAAIGRTLGVIDDSVFSAIVLMVIITTLMSPSLQKILIGRQIDREKAA